MRILDCTSEYKPQTTHSPASADNPPTYVYAVSHVIRAENVDESADGAIDAITDGIGTGHVDVLAQHAVNAIG